MCQLFIKSLMRYSSTRQIMCSEIKELLRSKWLLTLKRTNFQSGTMEKQSLLWSISNITCMFQNLCLVIFWLHQTIMMINRKLQEEGMGLEPSFVTSFQRSLLLRPLIHNTGRNLNRLSWTTCKSEKILTLNHLTRMHSITLIFLLNLIWKDLILKKLVRIW